jgi:GntR family transcriptional regulator
MITIERDSPVPLYHQLKQLLAKRINNGEWQAEEMLPTELQLQEQYQLSRITVRRSLKELELEGKISRFRGRGTFVAKPKISHSPEPHFSLTDVLRQQGVEPSWQVISADWIPAPPAVAERLHLDPGTAVHCLRRLRLVNDEQIGYHVAHAVPAVATAAATNPLDRGGSLDYLQGYDDLAGSYADRTLEAIPASEEIAALLGVDKGTPLFSIRRSVMGRAGSPIELLHAVYRGDRLQYEVRHRSR